MRENISSNFALPSRISFSPPDSSRMRRNSPSRSGHVRSNRKFSDCAGSGCGRSLLRSARSFCVPSLSAPLAWNSCRGFSE
jgi:hypothetical protein